MHRRDYNRVCNAGRPRHGASLRKNRALENMFT